MPFLLPTRRTSSGRWHLGARLGLVVLTAVAFISGCFGGQTGTEATPSGSGGSSSPSLDATKGVGGGGTQGAETPTSNGTGTVAVDTSSCSNPADASTDGLATTSPSAPQLVDFVQSVNPVTLSWSDASSGPARIQLTVLSNGCASSQVGSSATVTYPVQIELTSDDGRLRLVLVGSATARSATAGGIAEADLSAVLQCDRATQSDAGAACAIAGIDETPYARISIELSARLQSVGSVAQLLGSLRVAGSPSGYCGPEPCSISDWISLASVALTRPI